MSYFCGKRLENISRARKLKDFSREKIKGFRKNFGREGLLKSLFAREGLRFPEDQIFGTRRFIGFSRKK